MNGKENEKAVERLLRSLGIGATYRGYRYLNYGIRLCLADEDYLLAVSKLLYPQIAKYFHTTSSSVERDIRTAVKVCWERGNLTLLQEGAGKSYSPSGNRPAPDPDPPDFQ